MANIGKQMIGCGCLIMVLSIVGPMVVLLVMALAAPQPVGDDALADPPAIEAGP